MTILEHSGETGGGGACVIVGVVVVVVGPLLLVDAFDVDIDVDAMVVVSQ
jgi:hypothetical protein